jgi:hypothetical protein
MSEKRMNENEKVREQTTRKLKVAEVPFDDILELSDAPEGAEVVEISVYNGNVNIEYFDPE